MLLLRCMIRSEVINLKFMISLKEVLPLIEFFLIFLISFHLFPSLSLGFCIKHMLCIGWAAPMFWALDDRASVRQDCFCLLDLIIHVLKLLHLAWWSARHFDLQLGERVLGHNHAHRVLLLVSWLFHKNTLVFLCIQEALIKLLLKDALVLRRAWLSCGSYHLVFS